MLKIGIIGDHNLFRTGLRLFVESLGSFRVVLDAENHEKFFAGLGEGEVDLLLFHIKITDTANVMAYMSYRAKFPWIKVLIISQLEDRYGWERALELRADGVIAKDSEPEVLLEALHNIENKGFYAHESAEEYTRPESLKGDSFFASMEAAFYFTNREIEIIKLACMQLSSLEIGARLFISDRTVEKHRKRIMEKTGSKNFIGVIIFALKANAFSLKDL